MTDDGLRFSLDLPRAQRGDSRFTTATLSVDIDGERIWPVAGARDISLDIQVDDLLSHLTEFWKPLALRQTCPTSVVPNRPIRLRDESEKRWEDAPFAVAEREDALIGDFEAAHDLSRCFAGYFELPPLWLLRSADRMIVDSRAGMRVVAFESAWREITRLGSQIAEHLALRSDRWSRLLEAWRRRDGGDPEVLLS